MSATDISRDPGPQAPGLKTLRIDLYTLLAFLLARPPSAGHLRKLADMILAPGIPAALKPALQHLQKAARRCDFESVHREYESLFIGMGRGEIVPYASWYAEKVLMGLPLVGLRTDLQQLGICRQTGEREPEDHAAALCEAMVLILQDAQIPLEQQADFFRRHLASWMVDFFRDLQKTRSAEFYRCIGFLGEQFLLLEDQLSQHKSIEEV